MTKTPTRMISWAGTSSCSLCVITFHLSFFIGSSKSTQSFNLNLTSQASTLKVMIVCPISILNFPCHIILSFIPSCRTTLDLGIVKKSVVVDDVSKKKEGIFRGCRFYKQCFDTWFLVCGFPVVHFERYSFRTGSLQTGVADSAAEHRSTRAGLSPSHLLVF